MKKLAFLTLAAALVMVTSSVVAPAQAEELTEACSLQGSLAHSSMHFIFCFSSAEIL